MPAWDAYTEEIERRKELRRCGGARRNLASATTVKIRDGKRAVTDGPFAETKEWLGGYFLVDCPTLDEAIELAAMCPAATYGSIEVRPLVAR